MALKSHTSKSTVDIPAEKYVPDSRFPFLPILSYFNHEMIQPLTHSLPKKPYSKSFVLISVSFVLIPSARIWVLTIFFKA